MPEQPRPKPFVFVLMPFADEFTDVYELGIVQACKAANARCPERVDKQNFDGSRANGTRKNAEHVSSG